MESYTHKRIHDLLLRAKKPLFIADERIDGDSLGSSLAMVDYLKGLGRHVQVFVSTEVPEVYRFLPRIDHCTTDAAVFRDPDVDLVVSFDCSDGAYVGRLVATLPGHPTVVNIDHHATNPRYGHVNQVIVEAPATAEVVHGFFRTNNIVPSRDAATCLLTGICFDTTAFSNSGTNERSLAAASDLILHGAQVHDIIRHMFSSRSVDALRVWGTALERLERRGSSGVVCTYITQEDMRQHGVSEDEIEGLSNFLNLVVDAETMIVIRESVDGGVKASMRSLTKDVAKVAKAMGGGGHRLAAGFSLKPGETTADAEGCRALVEKIAGMLD
jgi:phosphoesterase RecJ-like protein